MATKFAATNMPRVKTKTVILGGGLDLETPSIAVKEGFAREAVNVEVNLNGGYRKMLGYERVDGRPAPSAAVYYALRVDTVAGAVVNSPVTGLTSGATGVVIAVDATRNIIGLTDLTGTFTVGETLDVGGVVDVEEVAFDHPEVDTSIAWEYQAQQYYRAAIQPVAGVGNILGVWQLTGIKYAWRSDGAVVKMFKATPTGWQEVTLYRLLKFNTGTMTLGEIGYGTALTGLTSGATGTVKNIIKQSGNYGTDAVGYFVIDVTSGTFSDAENLQVGGITKAVANGADTAIQFTLGDNKFSFVNYNFYGSAFTRRMYGVDGVNTAFEFDGEVLTPIFTGLTVDTPSCVEAHNGHLFLASGSSVMNSSTGEPCVYEALTGASEIAVGNTVRKMKSVGGDALMVSSDRGVSAIYGTSTLDFRHEVVAIDTGDVGGTLDVLNAPVMLSKRGVVRIDPSDKYGNFESATVSRLINPLLRQLKGVNVIGANLIRDKSQYRIYYDNGFGIIMTDDSLFGAQSLPAFTTFLYPDIPTCVASISVDEGSEVILFGAADGYVYQEERGFNFDGDVMNYSLQLHYQHLGSPSVRKAFKWLDVEIDTTRSTTLRLTYDFSDGQAHTSSSAISTFSITIGDVARWDQVDWDDFVWSGVPVTKSPVSLNGTGHNISLFFYGTSATDSDFTLNSITYQYIDRRNSRN